MIKQKKLSKIGIVFAVMLLLSTVGCSISAPPATTFPAPTPTPLPTKSPPTVRGWDGVSIETICLETELSLLEFADRQVEGPLADPIGETVRKVLANAGIRVMNPGDTCDATMVIETLVKTHRSNYGYGGLQCWVGGSLRTGISLAREGQEAIILPITARVPAPEQILPDYCKRMQQPEDFLTALDDHFEEPLLDVLVDLWGEQSLVWAYDIVDRGRHPNRVSRRLEALGPTDDVVLALSYALQADTKEQRLKAVSILLGFAPEAEAAIPYLAQATMDPELRIGAISALEAFGPLALDAVPMLIAVLEDSSSSPNERRRAVSALKAITEQDLGDYPRAWQRWWDRRN